MFKDTAVVVFLAAFLFSIVFQSLRFVENPIGDESIWTTAAQSVQTENPKMFPSLDAYMHPGGPSIEGTIVVQVLSRSSYSTALAGSLILSDSFLVALICALCFVLRKNLVWPITVLGLLSFQPIYAATSLYGGLTPPSNMVALALSALALVTLYLYENTATARLSWMAGWCALAGLAAASRIDAGGVMVIALLLLLATKYDIRKTLLLAFGAFVAFCAFDPFMWFAPITQIIHLVSSMLTHYEGTEPVSFLFYIFLFIHSSMLGLVSVFLGISFVLFQKYLPSIIPTRFLVFLLSATALLSYVFLTAHAQAQRYLMPLVFIWEVFFPLFMFSLISKVEFSFVKTGEGQRRAHLIFNSLIILLVVGPLFLTFSSEVLSYGLLSLF